VKRGSHAAFFLLLAFAQAGAQARRDASGGEFYFGARFDGYSNFQNYASGLIGFDAQYSDDFLSLAPPGGPSIGFRWGGRVGMLFDGLYNFTSELLRPRFYPFHIPIQATLIADFGFSDLFSLRIGAAAGFNLIGYPGPVISANFNSHAFTGCTFRVAKQWGLAMTIGWGAIGKWSFWNGPQLSLGCFIEVPRPD
jgi:hypothetical protein